MRNGTDRSKIIPFPRSTHTAQVRLSGPVVSAPLKGSGGSATARISQLLPHEPRTPVWQTADHNPARQLPEDLDNSGVSFDDLNNSVPTPNLLSAVGDQSIYWKLGQRADFSLSVSPL